VAVQSKLGRSESPYVAWSVTPVTVTVGAVVSRGGPSTTTSTDLSASTLPATSTER
jgi:hypothetical protein